MHIDCSGGAIRDVIFVVDTNDEIGFSRFQLVRELVEGITTSIKVNSPESLFGLITIGEYVRLEFDISRHTDLTTLLPAINPGIPYYENLITNIGEALSLLQFVRLRDETSNVAIVIIDSSSYPLVTPEEISSLHAANIFDVYTVDINPYTPYTFGLPIIASDPSFVFSTNLLTSFTVQHLVEDVIEQLCSSK